jgi:radical SAM protein with 4Fe4S-binding SPASM domain
LVDSAHAAGVRDIIVSGGEPFARGDIVRILAHMADLGMTARIATNGSLLTNELLAELRRDTLTKSFQVSLDTLDPDIYSSIHGAPPETLDSVLDALRSMGEHGFHTTVSVRLSPETLPGIPALLDRAHEEGWATVTVHCPLHTRRTADVFPQDADVLSILAPVFDHFLSLPERWLVETYIPWAQYHPGMRALEDRVRVVHRGCSAGRDRLTINPTGWISPCVCLDVPEACVGNVRSDGLLDAFQNSPVCKMFREPWQHGICADCNLVETCGGGCRAAAFAGTGRLDGLDPSCPVRKGRESLRTAGVRHAT